MKRKKKDCNFNGKKRGSQYEGVVSGVGISIKNVFLKFLQSTVFLFIFKISVNVFWFIGFIQYSCFFSLLFYNRSLNTQICFL